MPSLPVQIVRFVDEEPQPGIVESQFYDSDGNLHSIIDKVPLFTGSVLQSDSKYPQRGFIECRVIERIPASSGNLARINIEPYHVEWSGERSEFVINESDLVERSANGPSWSDVERSLVAAMQDCFSGESVDPASNENNLRSMCKWLARWLRDMLGNANGWGAYRSVDDILLCTAERESSTKFVLQGLLVWMDDSTRDWKEPLRAEIDISGETPLSVRSRVYVGDADSGLGKSPFGVSHDYPYVPVKRWLFTFVGPHGNG